MSDSDSFDLSARDLMPDWVTELGKPVPPDRHEKPANRSERSRSDRKPERESRGRHDSSGENRWGGGAGKRRPDSRNDRGGGGGGGRDNRRHDNRRDRDNRSRGGRDGRSQGGGRSYREPEDPLPGYEVIVEPAATAVQALARHIRQTGRAYPMADVARMILAARDRYQLRFRKAKPAEASAPQPASASESLFRCRKDGSLWLSRDEAISHVLRSPLLKDFYTVEEIDTGPPKGNFSVIAVCGISGQVLGPPNHHEYLQNVARLHRERFSEMSFERYKSRIEMHRDEETIEKWKQQVSRKRIYRVGPTPESQPVESADAKKDEPQPDSTDASSGEPESHEAPDTENGSEAEVAGEAEDPEREPEAEIAEGGEESNDDSATAEPETEAVSDESSDSDSASDTPTEEGPDTTTEDPAATDAEAEADEAEEGSSAEEEPGPESAATAEAEILENDEALTRHFREHYAEAAIKEVQQATIPGDIPGRDLSRPILEKLKLETDRLKRGFPLPMIQLLCRRFEKQGLKFFKRGKKALHVSVARPRGIEDEEALTDRIRKIVSFVREHPRGRVVDLLDALVPDYKPPPGGESFEEHHLTQAEHDVLADVRWLTMEGYLIEFPTSELLLGRQESGEITNPGKKRKRPARKRPSKSRGAAPTDSATESADPKNPEPKVEDIVESDPENLQPETEPESESESEPKVEHIAESDPENLQPESESKSENPPAEPESKDPPEPSSAAQETSETT